MSMTKRTLALLLAACMVLGILPVMSAAADAQILAMKVFDDVATGAMEYCIISPLEDAARLGADVVNLSLGSDNGFAQDDTAAADCYARLTEAGVVFVISAGNSYYSSMLSNYGDYGLAENPEISMIAAPSVYPGNLSVASVNNTVSSAPYLNWTDAEGQIHDVAYNDPNAGSAFRSKFSVDGSLPVNIIPVDGAGTYSDYYNAGFRGYYGYSDKGVTGIALVKRGGDMSFVEKINNASQFVWSYYDSSKGYYVTEYPVKAVIIYDEDPNSTELITMGVEDASITGISTLVKQYAMEELKLTAEKAGQLTKQLLVSTALPLKDNNGVYYSPPFAGCRYGGCGCGHYHSCLHQCQWRRGQTGAEGRPGKTGYISYCFQNS